MQPTIGSILKQQRQSQRLSQVQAADGICSQSMLSSIEHDRYTPNAQLLIALCARLGLALDVLNLATNYAISDADTINDRVVTLCNVHRYQELLNLLNDQDVIDHVQTDAQTQSYYYYMAVAQLQAPATPQLTAVRQSLQQSLASAPATPTALTRLAWVTMAYLDAINQQAKSADEYCDRALAELGGDRFDPNLNVVYYLAALTQHQLERDHRSLKLLLDGIDFITAHDSHFMLANCYYLIAVIAQSNGDAGRHLEAEQQSAFLAQLFDEHVHKP